MTSTTMSLVDLVRDVARERIAPGAAAVDAERAFPRAAIDALAEQGALGLMVPETAGGAGGGLTELVQACEAVGGACASSGMVFLMHCVTAATVAAGGGERANGYLRADGRGRGARHPGLQRARHRRALLRPRARRRERERRRPDRGSKSFVTSGGHASSTSSSSSSGDGEGLDCYAVTPTDGVTFNGEWEGLGMAGNSSVAAKFDNAPRRRGAHRGGRRRRRPRLRRRRSFFLVGLAAVNVGIAQRRSTAADRAREERKILRRQQPGGDPVHPAPGGRHGPRRRRQARLLVHNAAALGDTGDPGALVPIMEAKVVATEAAQAGNRSALEVCGGQGYTPQPAGRAPPARRARRRGDGADQRACCATGSARPSPGCLFHEPR